MRAQKLLSLSLLLLFFIPGVFFLLEGGLGNFPLPSPEDFWGSFAAQEAEAVLEESFPGRDQLSRMAASLQTVLGRNQQNGCFYSADGILQNLPDADEKITSENLEALQNYADSSSAPCYFLLSPTSAAIEQNKIPSLALDSLFNQKQYIQRCYSALSSRFRTIDGYNSLFSHQAEYLYYRTDSRLTALGCYYLYASAGEKLGYSARSINDFSISYPLHDYYGNLLPLAPYAQVKPDVVSLLFYQKRSREVRLVQEPLGAAAEKEMYDLDLLESTDPLQVYLGPDSGVTDLVAKSTPQDGRLLVFTDGSCNALFPPMAIHYRQIRVVNLLFATLSQLEQIHPEEFDQVLFVFSIDSFGYDSTISYALGNHASLHGS